LIIFLLLFFFSSWIFQSELKVDNKEQTCW